MKQISSKELKKIVRKLNNKSIAVEIKGVISILINIKSVQAKYTRKNGIIELQDNRTNITIRIETELLYKALKSENKNIIELYLDNYQDIRITVIE